MRQVAGGTYDGWRVMWDDALGTNSRHTWNCGRKLLEKKEARQYGQVLKGPTTNFGEKFGGELPKLNISDDNYGEFMEHEDEDDLEGDNY